MPCKVVPDTALPTRPGSLPPVKQLEVDTEFVDYRYARNRVREVAPIPVVREPGGGNITDWISYAVVRYRAIELANGE
eukprot:12039364-Heterocapsa_arctica.AAC.1